MSKSIHLPDLTCLKRLIRYDYIAELNRLRREHYADYARVIHTLERVDGTAAPVAVGTAVRHCEEGVTVRVSKAVTDLLLTLDFDETADLRNIPWLSPSVEFSFEDEHIPHIIASLPLLGKGMRPYGLDIGGKIALIVVACYGPKSSAWAAISHSVDSWAAYQKGDTSAYEAYANSVNLNAAEADALRFLATLACKVMVYCSINREVVQVCSERKQLGDGKSGVLGRPKLPAKRIVMLPNIVKVRASQDSGDSRRAFNGRRGHLRYYSHDRYVNVKGTWALIAPTPGPDGSIPRPRIEYVVR